MKLSPQKLEQVIQRVSPKGVDYRAGRMCRLLAKGPNRTGIIANSCSVGNISDVVNKDINPKIADLGLYVACIKPPTPIINQFGQKAGDHIWSFYMVAANDDEYEQGSSVEDWEDQLEEIFAQRPDKEPEGVSNA